MVSWEGWSVHQPSLSCEWEKTPKIRFPCSVHAPGCWKWRRPHRLDTCWRMGIEYEHHRVSCFTLSIGWIYPSYRPTNQRCFQINIYLTAQYRFSSSLTKYAPRNPSLTMNIMKRKTDEPTNQNERNQICLRKDHTRNTWPTRKLQNKPQATCTSPPPHLTPPPSTARSLFHRLKEEHMLSCTPCNTFNTLIREITRYHLYLWKDTSANPWR